MATQYWAATEGSKLRSWYLERWGYKNLPFVPGATSPLAYSRLEWSMDEASLGTYGTPCGTTFSGELVPRSFGNYPEWNAAYARAYAKFKDKAYTQAANLTALKERAKTFNMVAARLGQLAKGAKALRAGRFKEFLATFGVQPLKKHENTRWTRPKQFGALWLEYWMGWAPTVGDVYSSLDALSRRIPDVTIRAGSTAPLKGDQTRVVSGATTKSTWSGKGTVWVQGRIEVSNPSLHIAQTLGLINPLKTAWETTPFSWFADWFTNVGQILGQFTDWVGLKLTNLCISVKTEAHSSWECLNAQRIFGASQPNYMYHKKSFLYFDRTPLTEMPFVKPYFRLPAGLSLSRGATSVSLLLTMFAPKRA